MSFQPLFPIWAISAGLLLLAVVLGSLEWRRNGKWLWARLPALLLVLIAVAGLLLQPVRDVLRSVKPILLLTANYDQQQVDSLRVAHPEWEVWRTAEADNYPKSEQLIDLLELTAIGARIGAIVGEGLPPYVLEYFNENNYQFFPSPSPTGITALVDKSYREGQSNRVEGQYYHRGDPVRLLLQGPAAPEDSAVITAPGVTAFSLDFIPKESGRWIYTLQVKDSIGRLQEEYPLPVNVLPAAQLKILILQAFPTFEIRYLKDFLADRGHAVAVRAQISRDKYRTEFANLPSRRLDRLTTALLDDFDLLLTNGSTFEQLSYGGRSVIKDAVDNGLGLAGLIDGDGGVFRRQFGLNRIAMEPDTVRFDESTALAALAVDPTAGLEWYPIHQTDTGRSLAAYYYQGRGKVGFQSFQESFTYLLRGDSLAYAALWTPLLEGVQRMEPREYTIDLEQAFPVYAGYPLDFGVIAAVSLGEVYSDNIEVPMLENYRLDEVWHGRSWPLDTGWHQIRVGEEQLDYYAFPNDSWSSLARIQNGKQTLLRAGTGLDEKKEDLRSVAKEPVSTLWFYILFILGAGFLWLAPKL